MSQNAKDSLGVPNDSSGVKSAQKRKMTAAIIEDQKKEEEVYEFLEEDDDFEEFEIAGQMHDDEIQGQIDAEMNAAAEQDDKKLWKQDWDDEEEEEDFGARLRQEIKM